MEVLDAKQAQLTNYEVLDFVRQLAQNEPPAAIRSTLHHIITMMEREPAATQTPEAIRGFLKEIQPLGLLKEHRLQLVNIRPYTAEGVCSILFGEWDPTQDDRVQLCRTVLDAINRHLKPGPDRAALMRRHGATLRSQPASTKPPGRSAPQPARSTTSAATAATAAAAATGDFDENAGIVDDDFLMDYREGGGDDLEGGGDD